MSRGESVVTTVAVKVRDSACPRRTVTVALDDVVIGEDETPGVDQEARPEGSSQSLFRCGQLLPRLLPRLPGNDRNDRGLDLFRYIGKQALQLDGQWLGFFNRLRRWSGGRQSLRVALAPWFEG